jgi:hypothetical protein
MLPGPFDAILPLMLAALVSVRTPRLLPAALILAAAEPTGVASAAAASITWLCGLAVLPMLESKLARFGPDRMRGTPLRLVTIAALYFATAPFFPS